MNDNSSISSGFLVSEKEIISGQFSEYTELSRKGYNVLYKAKRYGKWHILKGLKPEYRAQTIYQKWLQKEFELGILLSHANCVAVFEMQNDPVVGPCIVMEYVDGLTLSDFLKGKPTRKVYDKILGELLSAMTYFHGKQLIHRDLKPSNILVTRNGNNVKIIDFGLSDSDAHVALKQPAGTLRYAAPEQLIEGAQIDCRADIYALGKILEFHFPYRFRRIAHHCARDNRDRRYASAEEVVKAIHRQRLTRIGGALALFLAAVLALLIPIVQQSLSAIKQTNAAEKTVIVGQVDTIFQKVDTVPQIVTNYDTIVKEKILYEYTPEQQAYINQIRPWFEATYIPVIKKIEHGGYKYDEDVQKDMSKLSDKDAAKQIEMKKNIPPESLFYGQFSSAWKAIYDIYFRKLIDAYHKHPYPLAINEFLHGEITEEEYNAIIE